jgi:hypothetical protein
MVPIGAFERNKMEQMPQTNMMLQDPFKKDLHVGDVFRLKYPGPKFIFGRIMRMDCVIAGMPKAILVYVYAGESTIEKTPSVLDKSRLLVAPAFINKLGFSRGFMPVVTNMPVKETDFLPRHCFRDFPNKFRDEHGEIVDPIEPIGEYGLGNYRTLDDAISKALKIPLAPDEVEGRKS